MKLDQTYPKKGFCGYILEANPQGIADVFCNASAGWDMVWDGGEEDSSKVRKYRPFCPTHQAIVDAEEDEDAG